MSEIEALETIVSCLEGIKAELAGIGLLLSLMITLAPFMNIGGK